MTCFNIHLPEIVWYIIFLAPFLGLMYMFLWLRHSYKKLLLMKARHHGVEFLNGEPVILMPESDYIELRYGKKEGEF